MRANGLTLADGGSFMESDEILLSKSSSASFMTTFSGDEQKSGLTIDMGGCTIGEAIASGNAALRLERNIPVLSDGLLLLPSSC